MEWLSPAEWTRASYELALPSRLGLTNRSNMSPQLTNQPVTQASANGRPELPKARTGITGLDEVTGGGLPLGRPSLICGPAGCGKTLLAMEFLVRGITEFGEPGVFVAFEETRDDLIANVASLGFDLTTLEAEGRLVIDHVNVVPSEMLETGDWDLEALLIRLGAAIDSVGARRVVIDTIETLFGAFTDTATLRAELRRLFSWLKRRGVTALITGERGDGALTRSGIEEYVSDCVIALNHIVTEDTSTRRLRVVKYRGSLHGTDAYPFLITENGITVQPITSIGLDHGVSSERVSTGVLRLDAMLGGVGFHRGSSLLVCGTAGTGKSTLAAQFCDAACGRGERALYMALEESQAQIIRNMTSVGIDLAPWVQQGLLRFKCVRSRALNLEGHLAVMQSTVDDFDPSVVVVDPVSDLIGIGTERDVSAMLTRQVDFLKGRGVTALFTHLGLDAQREQTNRILGSFVDTWLVVRTLEGNGEFNRTLSVVKSRGTAHSNQVREFLITAAGIELADVYVGPQGVLTGSARSAQEARERADAVDLQEDLDQRSAKLQRDRQSVEAQVAALWRDFDDEATAVDRLLSRGTSGRQEGADQRLEQGRLRQGDPLLPLAAAKRRGHRKGAR
jgi:circadian clock protein KaiC